MRKRILMGLAYIFVSLGRGPALAANQMDLPFVLHRGYTIVVQGAIGGRKGLNFIVDTGAVPSVVDSRLSHRLGLVGQADRVSVFAREVAAQRVVLPSVDVGPVQVMAVEALVQDLSFIEKGLGVRIDALIGLDVLGKTNFSIDFAASCLRFDSPPDPTDVWADMAEDVDFAAIEIALNGVPVRLMVDTGVKHLILFESRTEELFAKDRLRTENVSSTIGGSVRLRHVEPPIVRLGDTPLKVGSVLVLETPANLSLSIDGLLGVAALGPVRVDFNFDRRAIGWKW
jgi:predicted aspartyl protease